MKKILFLFSLLVSFGAIAQTSQNAGFTIAAQQSVDGKQYKVSAGKHIPYLTSSEVLSTIVSTRRHVGQIFFVENGSIIEVWQFVGGIANINLVKILPAAGGSGVGISELGDGYGLIKVNDSTYRVDTLAISTKANVKKGLDSLAALKQANLTLTTTGSSGPSTLIGATLNIPNYAGGGGGSGVQYAQAPYVIKGGDTISRRFNVMDYGAKGDSLTDDTQAIQAAINAADAAGGGEVFFPMPTYYYNIAGALNVYSKSQLVIPNRTSSNTGRNHITLMGESRPNYTPVGSALPAGTQTKALKTTRIKSTLSTFTSAGQAIIGTYLDSTVTPGFGQNNTSLSVENLSFEVLNNPAGSGPVIGVINYKNGSNIFIDYCVFYADTMAYRTVYPVHDIAAVELPNNRSQESYRIAHSSAIGFRTGYVVGEHTTLDDALALACYYGLRTKDGDHLLSADRFMAIECAIDIYVGGFTTFSNFNLNSEWSSIGKWYDSQFNIKDSANLATGQIYYTIVEAGFGKNDSKYAQSGGTGIHVSSHANGTLPFGLSQITLNTTTATSGQDNLLFARNGTIKWQMVMNPTEDGVDGWGLYDQVAAKTRIYATTAGELNLGGTTTSAATSSLSLKSNDNVVALTNIGLGGFTPNAWAAGNALQKGSNSLFFGNGTDIHFNSNAYYDGAWKYASTNATAGIIMNGGTVTVRTAASGTANSGLTWVDRFNFNNNGTLQAMAYGAGTLTTDAIGNITATSDERLKHIIGYETPGLYNLMNLKPIYFHWNEKSGNETVGTYLGFSAQNVKASIPHSTGVMPDGMLTLQDRAIMATIVRAVQEQQVQIED